MIEVLEYADEAGLSPFGSWFDDLDVQAAAKVAVALLRMEHGNLSGCKAVGDGVLEKRIDWGPGYRIYFGREGDALVILLGGGTKRRQQEDIVDAKAIWAEYKRRKRKG